MLIIYKMEATKMYDQEEIQAQLNLEASFFAKDYQERSMVKW